MWLAHDHYKWRAMRTFGIDEYYITGEADYYEKYLKFAEILPKLVGNPIYIWCALELKRFFGISEPLCAENAAIIYETTKKFIKDHHVTPRWCIEKSKVEIVCTTEDPTDDLVYHKLMKDDPSINIRILSAFRPDNAFYCEKDSFTNYLSKLSSISGVKINGFQEMMEALEERLRYFKEFGTNVSDNGMADFTWSDYTLEEIEDIFKKILDKVAISSNEINKYKTAFVIEMARLYNKYDFVMQFHIGTYLNANSKKTRELGFSTGFDCVDDSTSIKSLGAILDYLTELDELPKTILYPLNSAQLEPFGILAAGFCDGKEKGKVHLGAPWWFNDQVYGIKRQFDSIGNLYPVSLSLGMLTDSRSFLSYPRHELYRRVLCDYLGELIERKEYFSDEKFIKEIIESVCYYNVKEYFNW